MEVTVDNESIAQSVGLESIFGECPLDPENPEQFFGPKTVMQAPLPGKTGMVHACGALIIR